jgi:spoIIIJ-associated protein
MADQESATPEKQALNIDELDPREREAYDVMVEVCQTSGLAIEPVVRNVQPPYVEIELVGEDAAESFGRHGKSLDALQYLVNLIIGKKVGGEVRVVLDAADYRARRIETLTKLAHEYAAMVRERQEECELDPLPAHERRVIHNALGNEPDIRTYSEGEDSDRRVIIAPR